MKKTFLVFITLAVMVIVGVSLLFTQRVSPKKELVVKPIDNKGIFVGDKKLAPAFQNNSEIPAYVLRDQAEHEASLRAIDEAAEYIRLGNSYDDAGAYQEAVAAYQKAYAIGGGSRAVSGLKLAMTYEKLGRYDEGIALLDEMIAKPYLSANGIKNANDIRARLLAAKNQSKDEQKSGSPMKG